MNKTACSIAILLGLSLQVTASANESNEPEFDLPVQEVNPERLTEEEILRRTEQAQRNMEGRGTAIQRRQFDASIFNGPHTSPQNNNAQRLDREITLTQDPELEPYLDEYGRPIRRTPAANTNTSNAFIAKVRDRFEPEQSYELNPRQNQAIPVGVGLMNSIETSFDSVAVRTSDDSSIIEIEDGYIYITPNTMEPIGIIAYEDGVLESQVSLLLVPVNAPPAMVDVDVKLTAQMQRKAEDYQTRLEKERIESRAEQERQRQQYSGARQSGHTRSIVDTLTPVAQGQVPSGFSLSSSVPKEFKYPCRVAIRHETGQRLSGGTEYIDVVVMRNDLDRPYEVREEMCLSEDAKAVALFKASYLLPGQETEVYILRDKNFYNERARQNTRPRLTLGDD